LVVLRFPVAVTGAFEAATSFAIMDGVVTRGANGFWPLIIRSAT
jgi:hypothetical protein